MALTIRERGTKRTLDAPDAEGALDDEPRSYQGEPTEWKNYLSATHRAELEVALLDLCRFFVAKIAAEQNKSAAMLQLADIEHQVIVQGRNSAADEGRGSSARAQMFVAAKKLVAENAWPVEVWYEYAQSAFLKWTQPRKWYEQKYEAVKAGQVRAKIIMPTFASRKTRRLSEMTKWLDLLEHKGMRMICASNPGHHWNTQLEDVKKWWIDQAEISEGTSAASSKMIRNKQFEMLADGIVTHGYGHCYGYEPDFDPERLSVRGKPAQVGARLVRTKPADGSRSEAEWLGYAFKKRLAGLTWPDVARECYREGCRPRSGTMITALRWQRLLTAPRMIGCERKDGQLFRVRIEPLVSDEQFERLMALEGLDPTTGERVMERPAIQRRSYPLSGLLLCCCGETMIGSAARIKDGTRIGTRYKCSRPNRHQESADGNSWTLERAMDGKQHTQIAAELTDAFCRELCADAIANLDAELWLQLDSQLASERKPSAEVEQIEREIAKLDDDSALLDIQIARQRQPGYRGATISPADAKNQANANATQRAALVSRMIGLKEAGAPEPLFVRGADVRAEIRNCTDAELHAYVKRVFVRLSLRRSESSSMTPERRIEWQLAKGFRVSSGLVEQLLESADQARLMRYTTGQTKGRAGGTLADDAHILARRGLNSTEITHELNELGYRTRNGRKLNIGWVSKFVRRVMLERESVAWISPPRQRGLSDDLLDRTGRMREGGATWKEVSEAFGISVSRIRGAFHRRRAREQSAKAATRPGRLNRNIEVLCFEMRRLEGASWAEIAREMMRLGRRTPLGRKRWYPATAKHIVEQFERREPEWCATRLAKHEATRAWRSDFA